MELSPAISVLIDEALDRIIDLLKYSTLDNPSKLIAIACVDTGKTLICAIISTDSKDNILQCTRIT